MNVAATEAGSIIGFNDFFKNKGHLSELRSGNYERHCVYHDEDLNQKAREWVREHAFKKGEPKHDSSSFLCVCKHNHLWPSSHLPPFIPRYIYM